MWDSNNGSNFIVLEEQSLRLLLNDNLFLRLSFGLFDFATAHRPLLTLQADIVVEKDGIDLLRLRRLNDFFFGLGRLLVLLLCIFFIGSASSILILQWKGIKNVIGGCGLG